MTWKQIPSHPDYEASELGQIRRRFARGDSGAPGKPLSQFLEGNGYWTATLWKGTSISYWTHQLVCEAFHGLRLAGMEAAHENGISGDNRAVNLSWKTKLANMADKKRHGTENVGARNGMASLNDQAIRDIRQWAAELPRSSGGKRIKKGALKAIADDYQITQSAVRSIIGRRAWRHV